MVPCHSAKIWIWHPNPKFTSASLHLVQAFKKIIDKGRAVVATQSTVAKVRRNLKLTFSGLDKIGVDDAIAKLKADLEAKLSKDDWTSSPLKPGIASLTAQQVIFFSVYHNLCYSLSCCFYDDNWFLVNVLWIYGNWLAAHTTCYRAAYCLVIKYHIPSGIHPSCRFMQPLTFSGLVELTPDQLNSSSYLHTKTYFNSHSQKERLKSSASQKDVGIRITSDNIFIEGYVDDLKAIRDEINGILHTITGIDIRIINKMWLMCNIC